MATVVKCNKCGRETHNVPAGCTCHGPLPNEGRCDGVLVEKDYLQQSANQSPLYGDPYR